jgi:hypothetical protein
MTTPSKHEGPTNGLGAWLRSFQVVAWAFMGIRKGSESQQDFSQIKPVTVIVVGIFSALLLVLLLVGLVNWVIATQ